MRDILSFALASLRVDETLTMTERSYRNIRGRLRVLFDSDRTRHFKITGPPGIRFIRRIAANWPLNATLRP